MFSRRSILSLVLLSSALSACEPAMLPVRDGERYREGTVIVKFEDGADPVLVDEARASVAASYERIPLIGADALALPETLPVREAIDALAAYGELIDYAEPDFLYDPVGQPSEFDGQLLWGHAKINAPQAWNQTEGLASVLVAVIDSGVDVTHPDLANNIWRNPGEVAANGRDDDGNGYVDDVVGWDFAMGDANPDDDSFHGTHVAGTIGAVGGNGGLVGVAPKVKVMALKTLSPYGGSTSASIYAIDYARRMGAQVINASWGSYGYSNALRDAIARAGQANILFVAASGNGDAYGRGMDSDRSPMFPAGYDLPNIISVAATGQSDRLAGFSNYGRATVDIAAPGEGIASTVPGNDYM